MTDSSPERAVLAPGAGAFERHVFVCVAGKTCPGQGGAELHRALKSATVERCGKVRIRVNKSGCVAQCGHGPMVVVYPENVWYAHVGVDDVEELVEEHFVHGRPVERLLFRGHAAGPNLDLD